MVKSTAIGRLPCSVEADNRRLPKPFELAGGVDIEGVAGGVVGVEPLLEGIKKIW